MAIPEEVLMEIKYRSDIESVISPYVTLKRRGKNLLGLCPFHNEKTPSFTVYPESSSFYCFGCGVGGDIFTFTKLIENLDYIEAVKLLAERAGVNLPQDGYDDSMQKLRKKVYDINKETARFYHNYLMSAGGIKGRNYFTERGLTPQTVKHFGLGQAPDSWDSLLRHLKSLGYSEWEMEQANVISKSSKSGKYFDRFRDRAMFPVIDVRGNVIAFSGRAFPGDTSAKYINSSDTVVYKKSHNLFGINFAKSNCDERVILVEGNMDVVSLHQAGFTNAVAPLGTAFTEEQAKLLSRYTKEIVVLLDSDAAGQKAVMRALETMKNLGLPIRILVLPECKDPDEYIKKNGAARFKKLLEGAVSDIEYKLLRAAEGIDATSDDGRLKYLQKAAEILALVDDNLTADLYAGRLSEKYGVSKNAIISRINEIRKDKARADRRREIKEVITPRFTKNDVNPQRIGNQTAVAAEETLLAVLFQHPDLYNTANEQIKAEDFVSDLNRKIFTLLCDLSAKNIAADISAFGEILTPAEMGYLVSLQNGVKGEKNAKTVLTDCIKVILRENRLKMSQKTEDLSVDEWNEQIKKLIDYKKGD